MDFDGEIKKGRVKQKFTGKIINSKDFVFNIHGVLYNEVLPNGHKLIDVKIEEKRKEKNPGKEGGTFDESILIATMTLKLDKQNHCIETIVKDTITGGKSVTIHKANESEEKQIIFNTLLKPFSSQSRQRNT